MARYSTGMTLHTSSPAPATPAHLLERSATGSPFSTRRYTQPPLSNSTSQSTSEHTRLLIESLAMFEAQLAKLPPQLGASISSSSGVGAPHSELSRNAQGTVYAAERLASMLKLSSARAVQAQVEAEVDSTTRDRSQDVIDIWSRVASDYRDGSRAADELVRTLTSVLLGVGRIMRDVSTSTASEMGSPSVHGRNASLSEDASAPERQRTLTPLSIPKPLPILPSESANRRPSVSTSNNSLEKPIPRKSTSRGERPSFPVITSPSYPTTALTPHTVSTDSAFPLARTNSEKSTRSQVTFSRPSTMSVSAALNDIQQQHLDGERMRTNSTTSSNAEPSTSFGADKMMRTVSATEPERDNRRRTIGARTPRASLDSSQQRISGERGTLTASGTRLSTATVHAADRSAASTILHQSAGAKRDHRRTVTDIWPQE
ncbi:hypothetical protein BJ912DRAFT_596014 [Pholiota molesta]|nr:hypothetical protein BJ912DRAFT_596014 [Pholiota molesta]